MGGLARANDKIGGATQHASPKSVLPQRQRLEEGAGPPTNTLRNLKCVIRNRAQSMRAFVFVGADNPKAKHSHAHERSITSLHTKHITSSPTLLFLSSFSFIVFTFVSLFTFFFFYFYYYYCCLSFTLSLFSMAHTTPLQQNHNSFDYDPAGMEMEMERHRKRRKKWKDEVVDVPLRRDPLEVFGMDIMLKILSYLDARSVALSLLVSRAWHAVSSTDRLWASKVACCSFFPFIFRFFF